MFTFFQHLLVLTVLMAWTKEFVICCENFLSGGYYAMSTSPHKVPMTIQSSGSLQFTLWDQWVSWIYVQSMVTWEQLGWKVFPSLDDSCPISTQVPSLPALPQTPYSSSSPKTMGQMGLEQDSIDLAGLSGWLLRRRFDHTAHPPLSVKEWPTTSPAVAEANTDEVRKMEAVWPLK